MNIYRSKQNHLYKIDILNDIYEEALEELNIPDYIEIDTEKYIRILKEVKGTHPELIGLNYNKDDIDFVSMPSFLFNTKTKKIYKGEETKEGDTIPCVAKTCIMNNLQEFLDEYKDKIIIFMLNGTSINWNDKHNLSNDKIAIRFVSKEK